MPSKSYFDLLASPGAVKVELLSLQIRRSSTLSLGIETGTVAAHAVLMETKTGSTAARNCRLNQVNVLVFVLT